MDEAKSPVRCLLLVHQWLVDSLSQVWKRHPKQWHGRGKKPGTVSLVGAPMAGGQPISGVEKAPQAMAWTRQKARYGVSCWCTNGWWTAYLRCGKGTPSNGMDAAKSPVRCLLLVHQWLVDSLSQVWKRH